MRFNCCDILTEKLECLNCCDKFNFKDYLLKNKEMVLYFKDITFLFLYGKTIDPHKKDKLEVYKIKVDIFLNFIYNEKYEVDGDTDKIYAFFYQDTKIINIPDNIPGGINNNLKTASYSGNGIAIFGDNFIQTNSGTNDTFEIIYNGKNTFNMNGFRLDKYLIPELEDLPIYPFLGPNQNGILVSK